MVSAVAFWDKAAAKYDRKTVKGPNYAARIERAAGWVGPGAVVLDVGCAGGQITLDLARHVGQMTGIDLSPKLIGFAQARRKEEGVENASFRVATPDDPSLGAGSFDAITAYSVLHLVEDQRAALKRFHELLKPGGVLIAEIPRKEDIALPLRVLIKLMTAVGKAPSVHLYPQKEHEIMLNEAGFQVQEIRCYNPKSLNVSILATRGGA